MVRTNDRQAIEDALNVKKEELNLHRELKWTKITENYRQKYEEFIEYYFSFVRTGRIKVRIMFSQNMYRPIGLTAEQRDLGYFLLYYQMVKHAFGLRYSNPNSIDRVYFELLFDEVPHSTSKFESFKARLSGITDLTSMRGSQVFIPRNKIAQIDSKSHVILQGLDVILGAMYFRLNDLHRAKPEGARRRGKRTIAKENVYRAINRQIRSFHPHFNVGQNTGTPNGAEDRWKHAYRHWKFIPREHEVDFSVTKGGPR